MYAFPILAALTIGISFAILRASFDDLREAPLTLDVSAGKDLLRDHRTPRAGASSVRRTAEPAASTSTIYEANEGLLDHELASDDPIGAWLSRYLTPPAD